MTAGYYRFPTIHQQTIVFVSEDDLWTVPSTGGLARRLTSNLGAVTFPLLSPDGRWLAFVGREEGNTEVYVMAAEGGSAQRLTFLSSNCRVVGWMPDSSQIIFCSNYGQVVRSEFGLFTVQRNATAGAVTAIPCGPARTITYGPNGRAVLGRNTQDSSRWKRYRGGTTGHLWIDREGNGEYARFLDHIAGNIASPMWIALAETATAAVDDAVDDAQERIFFVSDHEGIGNLYSCTPLGSDLQRHTDHENYYVRNATTDGQRIVYHVGADLYTFEIATGSEQLVAVQYHSPRVQRSRRFVSPIRYLDSARLHPKGKALAVTTRGKAFAFPNHDGPVLQFGKREGVRYRLPEWTSDGQELILISDESGEESIEIYSEDPQKAPRRLEGLDLGRVVMWKLSPLEDKLALANHRHELLLVDLKSGELTQVDHSPHRLIAGFDWSPDGRWLAYGHSATPKTTAIRLYRLADKNATDPALHESAVHTITRPILRDIKPAFDPDGKYLYFLSYREFNPVYDNLHFELGFPWGMRPYLITLQAELPNPFIPQPSLDDDEDEDEGEGEGEQSGDSLESNDWGDSDDSDEEGEGDEADGENRYTIKFTLRQKGIDESNATGAATNPEQSNAIDHEDGKADDTKDDAKDGTKDGETQHEGEKGKGPTPIRIDLDQIERRILAFPVPDGRYGQVEGIPGKAIFTVLPVEGTLDNGEEWDEDDEEDEAGTLRAYNFEEYKSETLADDVNWFQLARNRKRLLYWGAHRLRVIPAGEKPQSESGPGRRTGWIDLHRVKVSVDPQREWEQMFREAWRLQRDHFWTEDMSEVDWQTVYQRYFPLIERVSARSEFSDLMWEMQGELGTSHAYEYGGDYRPQPYYSQGFLGTTFSWDAAVGGYRVGALVIGDPWDLQASSPLAAPGVDVQPGDILLAINGQRLDETTAPAELLVNQAGQDVLLAFAPRPPAASSREKPVERDEAERNKETRTTLESEVVSVKVEQKLDKPDDVPVQQAGAGNDTINYVDNTDAENNSTPNHDSADNSADSSADKPRTVIVRTIYDESRAYYRQWVEQNRRQVHEATNGRVGYVHIPDMGAAGYAEFHRGYLAEVDREALIVDVRYNGGGHVSQLILEKLARRRLGYDLSRWGGLEPYPADSVAGPIVALTNEHAGSDGDIFCHSFKLMKLGPLVGKRTWGGVIGISPRHALVDGTITTQPEFSFWFADAGWGIENYGTEPDIEVDITPQDYRVGRDPQLVRTIQEVSQLLRDQPTLKPDLTTRPSRALPKLPPRSGSR